MLEAIVLAGGKGTRLREVVPDLPKPMAPVAGRPFLEILLESLAKKGFGRVILSVGYMADKIINHFGDNFNGMEIIYSIETEPLGTGGAIRLAIDLVKEDHVYVLNGDTFLNFGVEEVEREWLKAKNILIVGVTVNDTSRYGAICFKDGWIISFEEKGFEGFGIINAGCYVLSKDILDDFVVGSSFSFERPFLEDKVKSHQVRLVCCNAEFIDIGIPDDFFRAQEMFGLKSLES